MFCHLFPPSPLGDVQVWLEASPVLYWFHLVPPLSFSSLCCSACLSSVFSWLFITCIPVFSLVMMALAQYSFKQLLSVILLPVVLSRFVLHRTESLCAAGRGSSAVVRSRAVVPAPCQRHPAHSCLHWQGELKCEWGFRRRRAHWSLSISLVTLTLYCCYLVTALTTCCLML